MKKKISIVLIIMIVLLITGCNNTNKTDGNTKSVSNKSSVTATKNELVIRDSGWTYIENDLSNTLSYGVVINNPKGNDLAEFPKIKVVGRNNDDKILFSYDETLDYIYPGETLYYGNSYVGIDERPDKIEINVNVGKNDWEKVKSVSYPKNTDFVVSNVSEFKEDERYLKFTGEIENKSSTDIYAALIVVIFKKDGKIVGGYNTYSNELNKSQKDSFEMYISDYPQYDEYEFSSQVSMIN